MRLPCRRHLTSKVRAPRRLVGWRQTLYVTLGRAVLETWNGRNNDYRTLERSAEVDASLSGAFLTTSSLP
jgi:hypothetical protein